MKLQQIRNAALRISYAGKIFLTDPWLAGKGAMGTIASTPFRCRYPEQEHLPMPLCDLPMPVEKVLEECEQAKAKGAKEEEIVLDEEIKAILD